MRRRSVDRQGRRRAVGWSEWLANTLSANASTVEGTLVTLIGTFGHNVTTFGTQHQSASPALVLGTHRGAKVKAARVNQGGCSNQGVPRSVSWLSAGWPTAPSQGPDRRPPLSITTRPTSHTPVPAWAAGLMGDQRDRSPRRSRTTGPARRPASDTWACSPRLDRQIKCRGRRRRQRQQQQEQEQAAPWEQEQEAAAAAAAARKGDDSTAWVASRRRKDYFGWQRQSQRPKHGTGRGCASISNWLTSGPAPRAHLTRRPKD